MNWNNHDNNQTNYTSTPKRRRLGTSQVLRQTFKNIHKCNVKTNDNLNDQPAKPIAELNQGDFLPCNQVEYLCDSDNNSSMCSDIICSPEVFQSHITKGNSFGHSVEKHSLSSKNEEIPVINTELQQEIEDISDDMFNSKLEQEYSQMNQEKIQVLNGDKSFKEKIEESFEFINDTICDIETKNKTDSSVLFDTKDSFLLDIRETSIIVQGTKDYELNENTFKNNNFHPKNCFYGLPLLAKGLFKTYKNIEKFYDWQEECLNLDVIKQRHNLIYALPTSGGKTLVAEVLMLQEVTCRKKNALFILPFVAIVQEKIWSLSPFALQMDFLLEEYAAGKGHLPPKKRRRKNSIYIATIEKGLALVRSLIELDRLNEIGLIVVDELHLIGEAGRGGTLETLLTTVIFANKGIQIVGMSATIGNLPSLAKFLRADIFERQFRPVELTEYVKLGDMLYRIQWVDGNMEVVPDRKIDCEYTPSESSLDPDRVCVLVQEVFPKSCLVFCATKRNCENVANMLCKLSKPEILNHRKKEREFLSKSLRAEGATLSLCNSVLYGVAYHHAGLSSDERNLLEHAYRCETINVLCCTSTLAAGVNLPAQRVVIRAPAQGRAFVTVANYRQMAGRAGRAGLCDENGESIIICPARDWPRLRTELSNGVPPLKSMLIESNSISGLVLSAIALKLASTRAELKKLMECTFLAIREDCSTVKQLLDDALRSLLKSGAIQLLRNCTANEDTSHLDAGSLYIYNDSVLEVSPLGKAAIRGCMELPVARQLVRDMELSARGLVLAGSLHLLYLVTPHDAAGVRPDYRHYYSLYCSLDAEGIQTAKVLGITEMNAIRMMTGKPITNVSETVLSRFYLALMLHDLWKQVPFHIVADKYLVPRGTVQSLMTSAASFASCATKFCEMSDKLWPFAALLAQLAPRLQHCAAPGLELLLELPSVKKSRALQLMKAGFKTIEDIAKASAEDLVNKIDYLSRTAATQLISAARMMLIEKVENLRAEAEDVMEGLNM